MTWHAGKDLHLRSKRRSTSLVIDVALSAHELENIVLLGYTVLSNPRKDESFIGRAPSLRW